MGDAIKRAVEECLRYSRYMRKNPGILKGEGRKKFREGVWRKEGVDLTVLLGKDAEGLHGAGPLNTVRMPVEEGRFIKRRREHLILKGLKDAEWLLKSAMEVLPGLPEDLQLPPVFVLLPARALMEIESARGLGLKGGGALPGADDLHVEVERSPEEMVWERSYQRKTDEVYSLKGWLIKDLRSAFIYLLRASGEAADLLLGSEDFLSFVRKSFHPILHQPFEEAGGAWRGERRRRLFRTLSSTPLGHLLLEEALTEVKGGGRGEGVREFLLSVPDGVLLPALSEKMFQMDRDARLYLIEILGERGRSEALPLLKKFAQFSMDSEERRRAEEAIRRIEG